jgi:DNA-binding beta-propeller fold protein YncE
MVAVVLACVGAGSSWGASTAYDPAADTNSMDATTTLPHLAAFSPDGEYAYITDDGSGDLVAIRLA